MLLRLGEKQWRVFFARWLAEDYLLHAGVTAGKPIGRLFALTMNTRRAVPADREVLFGVWLRSVRATHDFVSSEDIHAYVPLVRDYLASSESEFWVVCSDDGAVMGFMGLSGSKMEALFLLPECRGRGAGRQLVQHARTLRGELTTDVNEQNHAARRFYEQCGFVVEGRSELDDTGRPYPLLHMRLRTDQDRSPTADQTGSGVNCSE